MELGINEHELLTFDELKALLNANIKLTPGELTLSEFKLFLEHTIKIKLEPSTITQIENSEAVIQNILATNKTVYGINTGFGALADKRINANDLTTLQHKIVLSHAAGTGAWLPPKIVRLILILKINSLARGYSGVRLETIQALLTLLNKQCYPCIPCQGSVGASGDLAPLAHLSSVLLGVGKVFFENKIQLAETVLEKINLKPLNLAPKEGLALLNGTQVSTAIALYSYFEIENLFHIALIAGAMSVEAAQGSGTPFDERIQTIRGHQTQIEVAARLRHLLKDSQMLNFHVNCHKVQDPYSLRCQPQVMGACLSQMNFARDILLTEANAVTDNPLVFAENSEILSGGNFHAEPVAMAADNLALAVAEMGSISERRIALLVDPHFSGLPAFLIENPGLNSGFMIPQVTAAALASENKSLAHPASVDSIPTNANQEDHVSMATFAARRLLDMIENTKTILAIELLAAAQGIDLRRPLKTSPILERVHATIRHNIKFLDEDRFFAPDIEAMKQLINSRTL